MGATTGANRLAVTPLAHLCRGPRFRMRASMYLRQVRKSVSLQTLYGLPSAHAGSQRGRVGNHVPLSTRPHIQDGLLSRSQDMRYRQGKRCLKCGAHAMSFLAAVPHLDLARVDQTPSGSDRVEPGHLGEQLQCGREGSLHLSVRCCCCMAASRVGFALLLAAVRAGSGCCMAPAALAAWDARSCQRTSRAHLRVAPGAGLLLPPAVMRPVSLLAISVWIT